MDPDEVWEELAEAYESTATQVGDPEKLNRLANVLLAWINNGGAVPEVTGKPNFDRLIVERVCQALDTTCH